MSKVFFGGIPTEIDVKKLVEKFGVPAEGTRITHEAIAECIGHEWKTTRFRSVLDAWRKRLRRQFNCDTIVEPGLGLYVLLPPERIVIGKKDSRRGLLGFRRGGSRVAATPDQGLTEPQRAERDRTAQVIWRIYGTGAQEMKALEPPAPQKALPRVGA